MLLCAITISNWRKLSMQPHYHCLSKMVHIHLTAVEIPQRHHFGQCEKGSLNAGLQVREGFVSCMPCAHGRVSADLFHPSLCRAVNPRGWPIYRGVVTTIWVFKALAYCWRVTSNAPINRLTIPCCALEAALGWPQTSAIWLAWDSRVKRVAANDRPVQEVTAESRTRVFRFKV